MCHVGPARPDPSSTDHSRLRPPMHDFLDLPDPNLVGITLSDTLTEDDYEAFTSALEDQFAAHITTRLLLVMEDVDDWAPEERWEDLAFDVRHLSDVDKVAIVSDDPWERWLEKTEALFPMSTIQTYDAADQEEALDWIRGDMDVPGVGPGSSSDPEASFADQDE
ncbi:conserved hypothetical protein [Salinibacter ruber M8]|uniref:STAS/SEC14 domain-containing protein n=2 Tax=Salinibacter ruber TaxID=146919 RepID=D5HC55_SALRM|nr:conserved hypothetical protein [Salinibacter ruber M8]